MTFGRWLVSALILIATIFGLVGFLVTKNLGCLFISGMFMVIVSFIYSVTYGFE